MKINKHYLEALAFIAVYLFTLYLWTLPFQDNNTPYGEFDAISHWELADFIAQRDKTFVSLPPFLDYSYSLNNRFKPHTLWYHPPFHTDMAISSAFAGDRMIPIYLTNAIFATAVFVSVYFVMRKLFGFLPAILSFFLLSASMRDILPYLWGQWPERFGYAFVPLIMYCFYKYWTTYSKESSKPIYLYIMSILLAVNLFIHPLVMFHSIVGVAFLGIGLFIKDRKLSLNFRHILISLLIFALLASIFPYQTGNVIVSFLKDSGSNSVKPSLSRLFEWTPENASPDKFAGSVPAAYFSFKQMHGSWTLPFLILGIIVLLIRREKRDIFLLMWLFSLYLILHRDLIGKPTFIHRSLSASAHIFVPLIVIGALSISSLLPLPKLYKNLLKYGAAALVVILTFNYNIPPAYSTLSQAYDSPFLRPNQAQVEVSEWLQQKLNETENVSIIGPFPDIMKKVWWMASYSHRTSAYFEGFLDWPQYEQNRNETIKYHLLNDYIVFDYTDIGLLQDRSFVDRWIKFEQENMKNHALIYNKNNIRVYKYGAS